MEINLQNKTAWVFGGSRGIGRAIAIELAKVGANILLVARSKGALKKTFDLLCTKTGQQHDFLSIDIGNEEELLKKLMILSSQIFLTRLFLLRVVNGK